jgi:hypothetical protein
MTSTDTRVVRWLGIAFGVIAAGLLFKELELDLSWLVVGVSVIAAAITLKGAKGDVPWMYPVIMAGSLSVSVLTWMATKDPAQLIGIVASVAGLFIVASRTQVLWAVSPGGPLTEKGRLPALVTWIALALGLTALIGSTYFHVLTERVDNEARRLVLSLAWMLLSVGLLMFSQAKRQLAARDAGFVVLALASGKILFYDSTHLNGILRIAVFASTAALLYFFSHIQQRTQRAQS